MNNIYPLPKKRIKNTIFYTVKELWEVEKEFMKKDYDEKKYASAAFSLIFVTPIICGAELIYRSYNNFFDSLADRFDKKPVKKAEIIPFPRSSNQTPIQSIEDRLK